MKADDIGIGEQILQRVDTTKADPEFMSFRQIGIELRETLKNPISTRSRSSL